MRVFLGILIFFLACGWLVLLISATGLFYIGTVVLSILASAVLTFLYLPKISQSIDLKTRKWLYFVIIISLLVSLATCYFATPTIFGGRDQGSIATAAISLAKNHNLKIQNPVAQDLFRKYGPGKALNFPGFDYEKDGTLVSRFPVAYTAYLASAYNLAGLKGIQYANFIPLFLFLVIFWLILKEFFDEKISFIGFLLAATFFPFLWFAKYTLTEIYMLFLVWAGILFLIKFRGSTSKSEEVEPLCLYFALAAFGLSALTRIEGLIFFLLAIIYILVLQKKNILAKPKNFNKNIIIYALLLFSIFLFLNSRDLVDSLKNVVKAFLPGSAKESSPSANLYAYLARIFFSYNILTYLFLGLIGIFYSILSSRAKSRDLQEQSIGSATKIPRLTSFARNDIFLIIFITFPAFFYLVSPMITLDDPWLLRRFVFAVFPVLLIYSVYFLNKFFYHKIFLYFSLVVLIVANGVVSWRFFTLSENRTLLPQIEKISQKFGPDDLILVDRLATGSGFSLASEPLRTIYGKNAVYFFNAEDFQYINQDRYKNIYLIDQFDQENPWYTELIKNKKPQGLMPITNNFLEPSENKFGLAQNIQSKSFMGIWKLN